MKTFFSKFTLLLISIVISTTLIAQNNCLEFDGTDDYVNLGLNQTTLGADFTISAWVYPETDGTYKGVGGAHGGNEGIVFLQNNGTNWQCGIGDGTGYPLIDVVLSLNQWSHVSMINDGNSKNIKVYLNGILYGETNHFSIFGNPEKLMTPNYLKN